MNADASSTAPVSAAGPSIWSIPQAVANGIGMMFDGTAFLYSRIAEGIAFLYEMPSHSGLAGKTAAISRTAAVADAFSDPGSLSSSSPASAAASSTSTNSSNSLFNSGISAGVSGVVSNASTTMNVTGSYSVPGGISQNTPTGAALIVGLYRRLALDEAKINSLSQKASYEALPTAPGTSYISIPSSSGSVDYNSLFNGIANSVAREFVNINSSSVTAKSVYGTSGAFGDLLTADFGASTSSVGIDLVGSEYVANSFIVASSATAYIANLITGSYTTAAVNASTTNFDSGTSTNFFSTNLGGINLAATSALFVNATTSNLAVTNVLAINATSSNIFSTNSIGTNLVFTNSVLTNATSSNIFSTNLGASFGLFTSATTTNFTSTNALFVNATTSNLAVTNVLGINATSSNLFSTNFGASFGLLTNATTTNLTSTNLLFTNSTSTNLVSTAGVFTNATSTNNFFSTNSIGTNLVFTNSVLTNATSSNIFSTNLGASFGLFTSATTTNFTSTNALFVNATSTNFASTLGLFTSATTTNFAAANIAATTFSSLATSTFSGTGLTVTGAGLVGVGTSSPGVRLDVFGSLNIATGTNPALFVNTATGGVGIGTNSPGSTRLLVIQGLDTVGGGVFVSNSAQTGSARLWNDTNANSNRVHIDGGAAANNDIILNGIGTGKVGIGTSTPTASFTASGTIRFITLNGNATLQTDALGNVTNTSDERLKDIQGPFSKGLAAIEQLNPINYKWKPETGFDTMSVYSGFSAQNVQSAIPEAVGQNSEGYLTLSDRPIIATLVNAVKELDVGMHDPGSTFNSSLTQSISQAVANAFTAIHDLVVNTLTVNQIHTQTLCVDDVCVTKDQLKALLINAGGVPAANGVSSPISDPSSGSSSVSTSTGGTDQSSGGSSTGTSTATSTNGTTDTGTSTGSVSAAGDASAPPSDLSVSAPAAASTPDVSGQTASSTAN